MDNIPRSLTLALVTISLCLLLVPSILTPAITTDYRNSRGVASVAPSVVEAVPFPSFSISTNVSSIMLGQGEEAAVELTVTGSNGFNDNITMGSGVAPPQGGNAYLLRVNGGTNVRLTPEQPTSSFAVAIVAHMWNSSIFGQDYPSPGSYTVEFCGTAQNTIAPAPSAQYVCGTQNTLVAASAQIAVTIHPHAPAQPKLLFELGYKGRPSPGATIQLESNFTNIGNVQTKVSQLSFTGELGKFNVTSGLPLSLQPGKKQTIFLNFTIPSGIQLGPHQISATGSWQYYVPNYLDKATNIFYPGGWGTGNEIVVSGSILVIAKSGPTSSTTRPPNTLSSNLLVQFFSTLRMIIGNPEVIVGLVIYGSSAWLAVVFVIDNDRRKIQRLSKARQAPNPS